jgi:hypothetical protein
MEGTGDWEIAMTEQPAADRWEWGHSRTLSGFRNKVGGSVSLGGRPAEFIEAVASGEAVDSFCIKDENRGNLLAFLAGPDLQPAQNAGFPVGIFGLFAVPHGKLPVVIPTDVGIERRFLVGPLDTRSAGDARDALRHAVDGAQEPALVSS